VMTIGTLDPIVLGHNSFFGVNHLSREQGRQRDAIFEDTARIVDMMRTAASLDVAAMMMSTHPRAALVAAAVRREPALRERWTFYPLLPYITKYIRQSNEKGLVNLVLDQLKQAGWSQSLGMVARSGLGFLTKDYRRILTTLIDLELAPFQSLRVGTVFLHDVLTDLALALDLPELLAVHVEAVRNRFDARGGFATKNLPLLVNRLRAYGFERPAILAQVNKAGFGMNPSRSLCEQTLQRTDLEVMAMGTLASGYLRPVEAFEYVFAQPAVQSIVVSVSTPEHAAETFGAAQAAARQRV